MMTTPLVCTRCGQVAPPGTRYCPRCGEAVDPALVAELRHLYATLQDLDQRIAAGQGERTVRDLRADYRARYLALRVAPTTQPAAATTPAPAQSAASELLVDAPMPIPSGAPPTPASQPPSQPPPVPRPAGPAFSWQAFLADQAIAIMAYLGGFLLLVATLTFEVGGWQVLSNAIKLAVVCAVYLIFGVLGVILRRAVRLRTVARVYLGIFALMTPLVALAAYRFALEATGFPASGMLCLAALYAAAVYLALAQRTHLITYAYLGWSALLVGALALVPWLNASTAWWGAALGCAALLMLLARRIQRFTIAATLGMAATQVAALATAGALLLVESLAQVIFTASGLAGLGIGYADADRAALAVGSWALVALAAAWSLTLRELPSSRVYGLLTAVDLCVAIFAAQGALATVVWTHADSRTVAYLLALLALLSQGAALALQRLRPARRGLRYGLEGLALFLALGSLGARPDLGVATWTVVPALTTLALVPLCIAVAEGAPWWLLASGFFLTLDYLHIVSLLPEPHDTRAIPTIIAALALALWAVALLLGFAARVRRFATPLYAIALADALLSAGFLAYNPNAFYQTGMLLLLATTSYIAARRLGQPVAAGMLVGFFGALATLPFIAAHSTGLRPSALALSLALVALVVRRAEGRVWAYGPYFAALTAIATAALYTASPGVDTAAWSALGVSYTAWLLLLCAALAALASVWESAPWTMAAPAALGIWAVSISGDRAAMVALVVVFAGAGMAARRLRGPWWGAAWYVAAALGSLVAVTRLLFATPNLLGVLVVVLFGFALLAYLVAAVERQPLLTMAATVYLIAAAAAIPNPATFLKTLALTAALAALGVVASRRAGRAWSWALYTAAIFASVFAVARVSPFTANTVEALLLLFAAAAYVVTALERAPGGAAVSACYAAAAALAQPDSHALLPLALGLALVGLGAGRVAGLRWSYPFYAAAAFSTLLTVVYGQGSPRFEAIALLALALAAYAIAAVESRPDVLPLAFLLGVLATASASQALSLTITQSILAFAALAWVYALARLLWRSLPWLRPGWGAWWAGEHGTLALSGAWAETRTAGVRLHRWASALVGGGVAVVGLVVSGSFASHAGPTQALALALFSLAALLALFSRETATRLPLYLAGELVALALTWEARWLGATNIQAFVLAPGSYQLLIGVLLPADDKVRAGVRLGQIASLTGALLLTIPTLAQSFALDRAWLYAMILALEALVIAGIGVGTRARALVVVGSCFVGLAALRGAVLAIQSGLPVPLVIGALAVLLLGGATWLSLRARRAAERVS